MDFRVNMTVEVDCLGNALAVQTPLPIQLVYQRGRWRGAGYVRGATVNKRRGDVDPRGADIDPAGAVIAAHRTRFGPPRIRVAGAAGASGGANNDEASFIRI